MSLEKKGNPDTWALIKNRYKNGLILYSLRNLLTRTGIDIDPYYWVLEGTNNYDIPKVKDNSKYELKYLNAQDIRDMDTTKMRLNKGEMLKDLEKGQKCIALKNEDEVAAFMFIEYNDFKFKDKEFKIGKNGAYLTNMYTINAYRGKNLAPFLRHKSYELLKKQNITTIYSMSEYFNYSARKFKKKLKAKNISLFLTITLFKRKRWTLKIREYSK